MARSTATNRQFIRDYGTCLSFSAVNTQYVDLGTSSKSALRFIQNTGVFTIGAMVNLSSRIATSQTAICGNDATSVAEKGFIFSIQALNSARPGTLRFQATDGTQVQINAAMLDSSPITINDIGRWVFVAMSGNGTICTGYIIRFEGNSVSSQTSLSSDASSFVSLSSGDSTFNLNLGVCNGASRQTPFGGLLDEVFFDNYEMTSQQLQDIAFKLKYPNNTVLNRYKFDEGSGTTATDSGTGGLTGTLNGTVSYSTQVAFKSRSAASGRVAVSGRISA